MGLATVYSRANCGIDAPLVTIETNVYESLPRFSIIGLPQKTIHATIQRVQSALINSNFNFPGGSIVINLAPADLPKEGSRFDLPILLSILAATEQIPTEILNQYEFAGELALDGKLRPIRGALPFAMACANANRQLIVPQENVDEAALVQAAKVIPVQHVLQVTAHLTQKNSIQPHHNSVLPSPEKHGLDLKDVLGQQHAKRALEIAAAGGHSLLFIGPPGTGKTMLAQRLPSILPELTSDQALEIAAIQSLTTTGFDVTCWRQRAFRSPHHSASSAALVGGGNPPRPGEISLSHKGILFLDELPEFKRHTLEALREPLESNHITISRAAHQTRFPADFQLIATMNPCPCGYYGDNTRECRCTPQQIYRYKYKISGPLLDRIDMQVQVPRIKTKTITQDSATLLENIIYSRNIQKQRTNKLNADLNASEIKEHCSLEKDDQIFIDKASEKLALSSRAYYRTLKTARTIADLAQSEKINIKHLSEALSFKLS